MNATNSSDHHPPKARLQELFNLKLADDENLPDSWEFALTSWDEFRRAIKCLIEKQSEHSHQSNMHVSNWLFRGQRDASWKLLSTLDRTIEHTDSEMSASEYQQLACGFKSQLETLTKNRWDVTNPSGFNFPANPNTSSADAPPLSILPYPSDDDTVAYWAFLRHHGYPSPLLDWSRSPFVAAFFAYEHAHVGTTKVMDCSSCTEKIVKPNDDREVAVFAYLEFAGGAKAGRDGDAMVHQIGHNVRTHERHFLQQSDYTICARTCKDKGWIFCSHQRVLERDFRSDKQDVCIKLTLPASHRQEVLNDLEAHNINRYSLFGSIDALVEDAARRQFQRPDRDQTSHEASLIRDA